MMCDLHLYFEINIEGFWECFYNQIFLNIEYRMFSALNIVRDNSNLEPLPNNCIPSVLGTGTFDEYESFLTKKNKGKEKLCVTYKPLEEYSCGANYYRNTLSWCTTKELKECYNQAYIAQSKNSKKWETLIRDMENMEKNGKVYIRQCNDKLGVRAVFWFDN